MTHRHAQPGDVLSADTDFRFALDRLSGKWTSLIVYVLADGPRRHGELRRTVAGISQKMLTQTLRSLEDDGLVSRSVIDVIPPHVEYALTPLGVTLIEPIVALCHWTIEHLPEIDRARAANTGAIARRRQRPAERPRQPTRPNPGSVS